jgi:hypothetical protein
MHIYESGWILYIHIYISASVYVHLHNLAFVYATSIYVHINKWLDSVYENLWKPTTFVYTHLQNGFHICAFTEATFHICAFMEATFYKCMYTEVVTYVYAHIQKPHILKVASLNADIQKVAFVYLHIWKCFHICGFMEVLPYMRIYESFLPYIISHLQKHFCICAYKKYNHFCIYACMEGGICKCAYMEALP